MMMRPIFTIILFSLCVSCQTTPLKYYEHIPIGATKGNVLAELGNPKRTFRKGSVDHWIYEFPAPGRKGPREGAEREMQFVDGKLIKKGPMGEPKDSDFEPID